MENRIIQSDYDRLMLVKFLESKKAPFTVSITEGKHRTTEQNKLQRKWMTEISEQRGDVTPEEVRGECKLTFGVPILRAENEAFRVEYDKVIKPLPYEFKMKLMMEPFDFGVTRIMTTKQKTDYLDRVFRHFSEQGMILTIPEDKRYGGRAA